MNNAPEHYDEPADQKHRQCQERHPGTGKQCQRRADHDGAHDTSRGDHATAERNLERIARRNSGLKGARA